MAELKSRPVIAIIGAGAVGAYYGGRLAQHGHEVHFLVRSDYSAIKDNGFIVKSCDGDFTIPASDVKVHKSAAEMPKADLVIVTLKTTQNDSFEELIRPVVNENTIILTLQNGLGNEERLAALFGADRILGGIAFVCINRISPGVVHHTSEGLIRVGEFRGGKSQRLEQLSAMFNDSRIKCWTMDNLQRGRWQKLVWNIPFNGLGAALDLNTRQLLASEEGVAMVHAVMTEVIAVAKSIGHEFERDLIEKQIALTRTMGPYKTSMQIDREKGSEMEVEAILGAPARVAEGLGVVTPLLAYLYQIARIVNLGKIERPKP